MRFPSVAICSLTILLAGGLAAQASENQSTEGSAQEPVIPEAGIPTPTIRTGGVEAIAPPEMLLEEQRFLQTSAIESRLEPSFAPQNTEVVAQREVKTLAEVTPQNNLAEIPGAVALRPQELVSEASTTNTSQQIAEAKPEASASCTSQRVSTPESVGESPPYQLAQGLTTPGRCPRPQPIAPLTVPEPVAEFESSPALSIYIPVGYGADRNTVFLSGSYQASVREDEGSVGAAGIGVGLGDADKAVGVELSYALETTDDSFGEGGFNAKLHRRLGQDLSGALGWNGILNIGRNDFEQSKYGVITKIFRTQESLNSAFSRVAFTVGVGDGQFRSNGAVDDGDNNINVFGNVAVRVVRPVSFIAEWTGQDLALGLSIAPFRNFPFVITPAVRDLAGAGDGARFVLGAGTALRF